MSFQCSGHVIKERRYYCCKVNGQLHLDCIKKSTTKMFSGAGAPLNCSSVLRDANVESLIGACAYSTQM